MALLSGTLRGGDESLTLELAVVGIAAFNSAMGRVDRRVEQSQTAWTRIGSTIKDIAVRAIGFLLARAIEGAIRLMGRLVRATAGFAIESVKKAIEFDSALVRLGIAAEGAEATQEDLRQAALALGRDLDIVGVDAVEAAEGLETLFLAGLDAEVIFGPQGLPQNIEEGTVQMGAFKNAADLAAVSTLELDQAAELAVAVLASFGGQLTTTAERTELLDTAFNEIVAVADLSTAEIADFQTALKNTGPTAASLGFSFEEVAQALGVLADNGVRGAQAGTRLRRMFANLNRDTKAVNELQAQLGISLFDATGATRPLRDVMADYSRVLRLDTAPQIISVVDATAEQTRLFNEAQDTVVDMTEAINDHNAGIKILSDRTLEKYNSQLAASNRVIAEYNELGSKQIETNGKMTQELRANIIQTLAGVHGQDAFNSLLSETNEETGELIDVFARYQPEVRQVVGLQERVNRVAESTAGQIERLKDFIETLRIELAGPFEDALGVVVGELVRMFVEFEKTGGLERLQEFLGNVAERLQVFLLDVIARAPEFIANLIDWWNRLREGFQQGSDFVENNLLPIFDKFREWFEIISPFIQELATTDIEGRLLPMFEAIRTVIQENVMPALEEFMPLIDEFLPVAIEHLTVLWETLLKPAFLTMADILVNFVIPVLGILIEQMIRGLVDAIRAAATFYFEYLAPALEDLFVWLSENVLPELERFATFLIEEVVPAIEEVANWLQNTFRPAVQETIEDLDIWWDLIKNVVIALKDRLLKELTNVAVFLQGVFHDAVEGANIIVDGFKRTIDALRRAFNRVKNAIQGVIDKIRAFVDAIANVSLPSWLEPSSPPPLFYALMDIKNAMDEISRTSAPNLARAFASLPAPALAGGPIPAGATSIQDNRQFNLTTQTTLGPGELALEFQGLELASR